MGDKNKLYKCKESRLTYNAGYLLRQIGEGLAQGKLTIACDCGEVDVAVSNEAEVEVEVVEKMVDGGMKRKLQIELKWFVPEGEAE